MQHGFEKYLHDALAMPFVISAVWTSFHVAILMYREEKRPFHQWEEFYHQVYDILITTSLDEALDVFLA